MIRAQVLGVQEEAFVVIMEQGNTNLRDLIKSEKNLSLFTCRLLMKDILTGVDFLHSSGVVHLDIKSANCIVFRNTNQPDKQNVKLCDMGLARPITNNMRAEQEVSSLWYRAPELLLGQPYFTSMVGMGM